MMRSSPTFLLYGLVAAALLLPACMDDPVNLDETDTTDQEVSMPSNEPECDGHQLGEYWEPDSCNVCKCTRDGALCTADDCGEGEPERFPGPAPDCDGYQLGEMWMPDDCNTCLCAPEGKVCTVEDCEDRPVR